MNRNDINLEILWAFSLHRTDPQLVTSQYLDGSTMGLSHYSYPRLQDFFIDASFIILCMLFSL